MPEEATTAMQGSGPDTTPGIQRRDRFFLGMSIAFLLLALSGFTPTLYLRPFFDVPDIPAYLYLHGAVLTCWFLWLVLQTSLVAAHRTDIHRRIGLAGAVLGVGVVMAGLMATLLVVPRLPALGVDLESEMAFASIVVIGNIGSLFAFSALLTTAILLRRRSEVHKRLMLLASFNVIGPAFSRISYWPVFDWIEEEPFFSASMLIFFAVMLVHDLIVRRRIHMATAAGILFTIVTLVVAGVISGTEFGHSFVRSLG
jgi:hypothetical protein